MGTQRREDRQTTAAAETWELDACRVVGGPARDPRVARSHFQGASDPWESRCESLTGGLTTRGQAERSLPPELPTSAVEFAEVKPRKNALAFADFSKWAAAWRQIDSPVRRGYFLFCLLSGCRPGEGARIRWTDIDARRRVATISAPKMGAPIEIALPHQKCYRTTSSS